MGKAINIAVAFDAYILSDKATWLNHKNKGNLTKAKLIQKDLLKIDEVKGLELEIILK